jgi:formylglycine-generating enzyme required for sulfatase activity
MSEQKFEINKGEISMGENWIEIPAGEFLMGAQKLDPKAPNYDPEAYDDESPVHPVFLSAYRIGRYPVTVAEYLRFVGDRGYEKGAYWKEGGFGKWKWPAAWAARDEQVDNPTRPVVGVSWYEASAYAAWAGCRLPTEAEWERAACGRAGWKYPWGDDPPNERRANFSPDGKPNVGHPTPVGEYPLGDTPEGVSDMAGNVWEWCSDVFDEGYYGKSPKKDPRGPARSVKGSACVLRGGSWLLPSVLLRSACRSGSPPVHRLGILGFRVVCVLSPGASL